MYCRNKTSTAITIWTPAFIGDGSTIMNGYYNSRFRNTSLLSSSSSSSPSSLSLSSLTSSSSSLSPIISTTTARTKTKSSIKRISEIFGKIDAVTETNNNNHHHHHNHQQKQSSKLSLESKRQKWLSTGQQQQQRQQQIQSRFHSRKQKIIIAGLGLIFFSVSFIYQKRRLQH